MEERIRKAYERVNISYEYVRGGHATKVSNSETPLNLKLEELRLTHEYAMKKQVEKEGQAELRQQLREEARLEDDLRKTEREEEKYQKLLEKAQKEATKVNGEKEEILEAKIAMLTQELNDARTKTERAKSLAQQTKRGHIYVISNKGSFGENVYKIGMTRRAAPQDRVDELGDASVPFKFDVHAVIYTEDAPALEKVLHKELDHCRVNLMNYRKEFFKTELSAIQTIVTQKQPNIEFVVTAEAKEYHESFAIRASNEKREMDGDARKKFPTAI